MVHSLFCAYCGLLLDGQGGQCGTCRKAVCGKHLGLPQPPSTIWSARVAYEYMHALSTDRAHCYSCRHQAGLAAVAELRPIELPALPHQRLAYIKKHGDMILDGWPDRLMNQVGGVRQACPQLFQVLRRTGYDGLVTSHAGTYIVLHEHSDRRPINESNFRQAYATYSTCTLLFENGAVRGSETVNSEPIPAALASEGHPARYVHIPRFGSEVWQALLTWPGTAPRSSTAVSGRVVFHRPPQRW